MTSGELSSCQSCGGPFQILLITPCAHTVCTECVDQVSVPNEGIISINVELFIINYFGLNASWKEQYIYSVVFGGDECILKSNEISEILGWVYY